MGAIIFGGNFMARGNFPGAIVRVAIIQRAIIGEGGGQLSRGQFSSGGQFS